ncbi:MAG: PLP-dependent aminotransferase family protein [Thermoleophilaceae bacterium]|nr:PLP-dependent aminotransferase family protein [Thermoleophilaceae bacterium]
MSELKRDGGVSITQQIVDGFVEAIESGALDPGEKLPTTRALAAEAGVNHLTAARAYRRLAELGYVTAAVGRGTFVRSLPPGTTDDEGDDWQVYALPDRPPTHSEQIMADAFRLAAEPDVISLNIGWPSPKLFPTEELAEIAAEVFREEPASAIGYGTAEGIPELREQIAELGRASGFASHADEIVVTSGARQAIDITCRALIEPGDVAVIESPTFMGLLTSLRVAGAHVIGVPSDEDGFDVGALERVLARHEVQLVALQTASQNPTGQDLVPERRERLAQLAIERNFFVVEDGVYAAIRFDSERPPPLRAAAPGHVIYIDSISKIVGGGLRVGWLAARGPVRDRLAAMKLESDFHTATLTQHVAARFMASGGWERHLERALPFYKERRDAALAALEKHLPGEYEVHRPPGGHHLWVTLRRPVDERALYAEAVRQGVTFTPGSATRVERAASTDIRISFGMVDPDEIDEGLRRLARALREVRRGSRLPATVPVS